MKLDLDEQQSGVFIELLPLVDVVFCILTFFILAAVGSRQQAGLEGFLLGATAGMLRSEAWLLALSAAAVLALVLLLRRPLTLAAFDPGYAEARVMFMPRASAFKAC